MERPFGFSASSRAIVHVWFASWAAFFLAGKAAAHRTHWWGMVLELLYLQGERMWRLGVDS